MRITPDALLVAMFILGFLVLFGAVKKNMTLLVLAGLVTIGIPVLERLDYLRMI